LGKPYAGLRAVEAELPSIEVVLDVEDA
jgi:hypothetical protein